MLKHFRFATATMWNVIRQMPMWFILFHWLSSVYQWIYYGWRDHSYWTGGERRTISIRRRKTTEDIRVHFLLVHRLRTIFLFILLMFICVHFMYMYVSIFTAADWRFQKIVKTENTHIYFWHQICSHFHSQRFSFGQ